MVAVCQLCCLSHGCHHVGALVTVNALVRLLLLVANASLGFWVGVLDAASRSVICCGVQQHQVQATRHVDQLLRCLRTETAFEGNIQLC